ncbi:deoxyribose-phosphate aldolase [Candidatus Leptofilum sp.]|uniref:deoxyribose-phosphate aldolase n=1 Tax=Candidatus Leptofilum sp. TaxID=3241576 RepID=UPI003B59D1CE
MVNQPYVDARQLSKKELAKLIQFTNVRPQSSREEIAAHVEKCGEYGFDATMVQMCWVPMAKEILRGTDVQVATCIGLPMGGESLHAKIALVRECFALGADTVDYEPNMGFYRSGMYDEFREEGAALVRAAEGREIKAMLEFGFLYSEEEKRHAVQLLTEAEVHWIKNSSGWGEGGIPATVEDMRLIRSVTEGTKSRVKASGKVNGYEWSIELLNAGAELIGSSTGSKIIDEYPD